MGGPRSRWSWTPDLELVVVNDIGSLENMAYLLKYDTVYGRYEKSGEVG